MKKVYILLPEGGIKPSSIFNTIEVFEKANEFARNHQKLPFYSIEIVGASVDQPLLNAQFRISSLKELNTLPTADLIIITGIEPDIQFFSKANQQLQYWLIEQYKEGAEIASLCTGTFFLAATGLLNGKECSTHWMAEEFFRELFPGTKLCADKILTESNGLYTTGGAHSSLNLLIYLVEKYQGRPAALFCAKVLQIEIDRNSQAPFILFEGQKKHNDDQIRLVQEFIEKNVSERISVDELSEKFAISRRSFIRRFKKATHNSPIEYIQKIKMEAAKRSLESSRKNVNEVMYTVGYNDVKAFRTVFKKVTGLSPVDYRNKYNKDFYKRAALA